jgi:hypothetical protein
VDCPLAQWARLKTSLIFSTFFSIDAGKVVGRRSKFRFGPAWSRIGFKEKIFETKIQMRPIELGKQKKRPAKTVAGLF